MGLSDLFRKKMSPQEAFDLLLDGTAKKSDLQRASEITNISASEYMAPAIALTLFLGLDKNTDTYPAAYNSIMMSVYIGLSTDNKKCITNAEKIILKYEAFANEIVVFAKSMEKRLHDIYLAYAFSHGWGVEVDKKKAMEYAIKVKENFDGKDKNVLTAVEKIIEELNV